MEYEDQVEAVAPEVLKVDVIEVEYVPKVLKVDVIEVEYVPTIEMSPLVVEKHVDEIAYLNAQDEAVAEEAPVVEKALVPSEYNSADLDKILAIYKSDLANAMRVRERWINMDHPSEEEAAVQYEEQIAPLQNVIEALHDQGAKGC